MKFIVIVTFLLLTEPSKKRQPAKANSFGLAGITGRVVFLNGLTTWLSPVDPEHR